MLFNDHLINTRETIKNGINGLDAGEVMKVVTFFRNAKRIVICSMGKPAFACAKVIYTAHSFGLDWVELDATHAFHGDIGIIREGDLIVVVSKSGETSETNKVARYLNGFVRIAITSGKESTLSNLCDFTLNIPVDDECSPFGYAPMASTTLYMMVLHALLVEAVKANHCTIEQYARNHQSGEIGKKLRPRLTESSK